MDDSRTSKYHLLTQAYTTAFSDSWTPRQNERVALKFSSFISLFTGRNLFPNIILTAPEKLLILPDKINSIDQPTESETAYITDTSNCV